MELITINPTEVTVREGLERFRKDLGDLQALADSFKKTGQILPIVINRQMELIDGGRRLAACILAGMQVAAVYRDTVDPDEMRMLELEANLHRKDYTPAEEAMAVKELHERYQKKFGATSPGQAVGHSMSDTAKILGKTKGHVKQQIDIAAMVEQFPQLLKAKKKSEITKAAKGLAKVIDTVSKLQDFEEKIKEHKDVFTIHEGDALEHMKGQPDGSVDILLTDPLYGIEAHKLAIGIGGKTGGMSVAGYTIPDEYDLALTAYIALAHESYRFTAKDAHGYVFVAPEHYHTIRKLFLDTGWRVFVKPLIWTKQETGQCNVPASWPASCYEMLLYIRKDDSRIVKQGMPDWIPCPPVTESNRLHQYEKPVPLLTNLLERVALPGLRVYDPFMGSGSSLEAAVKLQMFASGCDNSHECYAITTKRLAGVMKEKEDEK